VYFDHSSQTINEGARYRFSTHIRSFPPIGVCFPEINVKYSISAGTATAGSDFTPASGTVYMSETMSMVSLGVNIIDDSILEDDETVILTLLPGEGYDLGTRQKLGERTTNTLTIADNDTPQISFASAGRTVSEAAGTVNTRIDIAPALTSAMNLVYTVGGTANVEYAGIAGDAVFFLKNPLGEDDFRVIHPISVPPGVTTMDIVNNWRGGRCA